MEVILMILISIVATVAIVWAVKKIGERYYNNKALRHAADYPDTTKQKKGVVYNESTKELEADQSTITPF
jgi:hypothetical protein